jgi:hypothetical protein
MALTSEGLFSWGSNHQGQLGLGEKEILKGVATPQRLVLPNSEIPEKIFCGGYFSAVITKNKTLWIWGSNESAELGVSRKITSGIFRKKFLFPPRPSPSLVGWKESSCLPKMEIFSGGVTTFVDKFGQRLRM